MTQAVKIKSPKRINLRRTIWGAIGGLCAGIIIVLALVGILTTDSDPAAQHYYYQAINWLHGSLTYDDAPVHNLDAVYINNHWYLPLGPLPAVIITPFVALFGIFFKQIYVSFALVAATVWIVSRILRRLGVIDRITRRWLTALFFLSSVYLFVSVRNGSWFLAHVVVCFFLFLGIYEVLGKKRPLLLGVYLGLAATARITAGFTFPFFLILLAFDTTDLPAMVHWHFVAWRTLFFRFFLFGLAAVVPLSFYFGYNFARFGSFLETGYNTSALGGTALDIARAAGLFSLAHIPKNLYYFFMAMPEPYAGLVDNPFTPLTYNPADIPVLKFPFIRPSAWGMSIFLTTPAIIYVVKAKMPRPIVIACWAAIILTAIPIFTYYGIGWRQMGYRYALDFTPFLWLLIVLALRNRRLTLSAPTLPLWLIIAGIAINTWGALIFTFYPPY